MKFSLNPKTKFATGASAPSFNISAHLFCCFLFFKEYLNPQARIEKLVNERSVNYYNVLHD